MACGHTDIQARPEVEGWENPTEPVVVILYCNQCGCAARVTVEDVALLTWTTDPWGC